MFPGSQNYAQQDQRSLPLTLREHDVLRELAQGCSNKEIARALSLSPHTVDGYVKEIYRKLGIRNRSMATVVALQYGILDWRSPSIIRQQDVTVLNHA